MQACWLVITLDVVTLFTDVIRYLAIREIPIGKSGKIAQKVVNIGESIWGKEMSLQIP